MQETQLADIDFSDFSSLIFKVNHYIIGEEEFFRINVFWLKELDHIDIDGMRNLEDLARLMMKNVGILMKSLMVESLLEISIKRRSQRFYEPIDVHSIKNVIGKSISSIGMWNSVNHLGKHDFSGATALSLSPSPFLWVKNLGLKININEFIDL